MADADVIVIGSGVNGLAAARVLKKAGRKVLVLERRDSIGGLASSEEFHPGYRTTGVLHDASRVHVGLLAGAGIDLPLRDAPELLAAQADGPGKVLWSEVDGAGWRAFIEKIRGFSTSTLQARAPEIGEEASFWPLIRPALGFRRLGAFMMELLRIGPTACGDFVAEWFDDPLVQAAVMAPALLGTWMGPRSPSSTAMLLLAEVLAGREVVGGPAGLVESLSAGVDVRTGAGVKRIRVEGGKVVGVELDDGSALDASIVLSTIGPMETVLGLLRVQDVPADIERDVADIRTRGIVAKLDLALSGPLSFREGLVSERIHVGETWQELEKAFDAAKHRRLPERPTLDIRIPTVSDPSLAPTGHHVASVLVTGATIALDGGWTDEARKGLLDATLGQLSRYVPDVRDRIVAHRLRTPADIEADFGARGGHLFHGELALDQLWVMRPTAALARHSTPIPGLYLGSAGEHPGGHLGCGPGVLAAREILN